MLQAEYTLTFMYGLKKITIIKQSFQVQSFGLKTKFCEIIFRLCLLHQLTGKFYFSAKATLDSIDNTVVNNPNNDKSDSQRWYCYCLSEEFGEMIACDFIMCSIEWFHIKYQRENGTALIIKT